ncbi:DUF1348-domain-containing protein [Sistotremastrum niveocremeum HHB9708]|uniref:DUF1348-domain-containing protein n=1 Tax=Sistotremastrum niveocremeum HHB9708 TaxID=1314777 RepID=A0A164XDP5_9AGAM|nr:DUF1348-domain-containing protein [Sistotremastrum niveocremeum HHB9708]
MSLAPPYTKETAHKKVKIAQALWNTTDAAKVTLAYTEDSIWRNRDIFIQGHDQIRDMLTKKWQKETRYRLRKELFAFTDNKIAVQFWYEYFNVADKTWNRCYGLEDWTFRADGKMEKRQMSGNEIKISEDERWFKDGMTDEEVDALAIGPQHW